MQVFIRFDLLLFALILLILLFFLNEIVMQGVEHNVDTVRSIQIAEVTLDI